MVFCYQNCSDLLWEKIVLAIEKNFKEWKVRTIFGNKMLLKLGPGGFSCRNKLEQFEFKFEKLSGFKNIQEKLENTTLLSAKLKFAICSILVILN